MLPARGLHKETNTALDKYKPCYRQRLCAKATLLDYTQTLAPVAKFASLRTIAMAATEDTVVHHMDVSSAYLNGALTISRKEISPAMPYPVSAVKVAGADMESEDLPLPLTLCAQ